LQRKSVSSVKQRGENPSIFYLPIGGQQEFLRSAAIGRFVFRDVVEALSKMQITEERLEQYENLFFTAEHRLNGLLSDLRMQNSQKSLEKLYIVGEN
jgi:hypothetical protein